MLSTTFSQPVVATAWDHDNFNPILPFNPENPLKAEVESDHAEIAIRIGDNCVINSWNISNPNYHRYFKFGQIPPFHKTHLFVEVPYIEGIMNSVLKNKCEHQIETIADRFVKREVNVQIIIEGFESFYNQLAEKIIELGQKNFEIVSMLNNKPQGWDVKKNVTGILVDTSRFTVLNKDVIFTQYTEEGDSNSEKEIYIPYVHLKDKLTNRTTAVVGSHINGCNSQFPKTGLEVLAKTMEELRKKTLGQSDILAAGDFNTTPISASKALNGQYSSESTLLKAPYATHVNPNSDAANYDQAIVLFAQDSDKRYEMMSATTLSQASQALIQSIEENRQKYLLREVITESNEK